MDDSTFAHIRNHIKLNEGTVSHPYLDKAGLITAGTGFNLNDRGAFTQQPWQVADGNGGMRPASPAEIGQGYDKMVVEKGGPKGRPASAFRDSTNLRLPDDANAPQLDRKIQEHVNGVVKDIGQDAWDGLSDGQKAVMTDVRYANGNLGGFTELKKKAIAGDAQGMANESSFKSDGGYNWDRVARNRAEAQGIPFEDGQKQVADKFKSDPSLPDNYKALLPKDKTSDAGDGIDFGQSLAQGDSGPDSGPLTDRDVAELTPNFAPDSMVLGDLDLA